MKKLIKNGNKQKNLILSSLLIISFLCFTTITASVDCDPIPYPPGVLAHLMTYDPVNDMIIVYGGTTGSLDTDIEFETRAFDVDNNNWTNLNPAVHPYPSTWGAMAYDTESEKIVQFGGVPQNDWASNETWIYDYATNTWTKANPIIYPEMRSSHVMAYDSESDVVIMHGGGLDGEDNPDGEERILFNDTWAYDLNSDTWINMNPTGLTIGLTEAQMTYDSESDRCIMVGGYFIYPYDDPHDEYYTHETWAYDYNSNHWENIITSVHPTQRYDHALAYDSESDRTILVGGWTFGDGGIHQNETWAFDYNTLTWENMNPVNNPKRIAHQMAYDEESDLIILFAGLKAPDISNMYNTIFTYDYNTNNWTVMASNRCSTTNEDIFYIYPMLIFSSILIVIFRLTRKKK